LARLLVTGASGFIGRRLTPALVKAGHTVVAPVRREQIAQDGIAFPVVGSLETIDWRSLIAGVEGVVHLAGVAHTRKAGAEEIYDRVNAEAVLRLAEKCEGRVGRFVFASSIRAIAGPTSAEPLDDESPARPTDAYGRAKLKAENGLAKLQLPTTILRPVVVYGEGAKGNLARLAKWADSPAPLPFGALNAPRSFLSLDNLIDATLFALGRTGDGVESFVLADPEPSNVSELMAGLREGLGRPTRLPKIPPALLGLAARIARQHENWALLAGPLAVRPRRLIEAGWLPAVASTRAGARRWGQAMREGSARGGMAIARGSSTD
jgi:UDP-glucose 4-epimerase